ncbi:MAG TPA: peptidoglycan DD-metalloendopeptidase family protein [Candidatus Anaerotignum merdipullorum]|nr:peptidoglycan DD-metalloendopeptidase family protein [Candidatus Anaerotignum merdipullorum]
MKFYQHKKIACAFLALVFVACAIPDVQPVYAKSISELQEERQELAKKTQEAMEAIEDLESKQLSVEEEMNTLDQAMSSIQAELDAAEADLETITESLEQSEKELAEATEKRDEQFDLLGKRMKYLQQKGAAGYLEILLDAESFSDLFLRMQYVNDIMEYDKQMLDELQAIQDEIAEKTEEIKVEQEAQEQVVAEYNEKMESMNAVLDEKKALIASYQNDVSKYEQMIAANERADQEVLRQIAQQQESSTVYYTGSGTLGWPVPSRSASSSSLSSGYVNRTNPITGRAESHSGYDIPAAYGAAIVAAESGVVTYSGWMNGYGNTVMISHGGGLTTLYAHNSSLTVSVGENVTRGQTIARCGSTGMSTGNHCHFSVLVNGSYVNPASYLGVANVSY